jgi:dTMP kinase
MTSLCRKIVAVPLITFEGHDGCGKSTQAKRLAAGLEKWGIRPAVLREPGGTLIGEAIRHLLQHSEEYQAMTPETELLLFQAGRSQLVREKIQPALRRGEWVICNCFFDSTTVYQGAARQLDLRLFKKLKVFAVGDCVSDLTFVLDIDRATAQSRLGNGKKIRDRMEESLMNSTGAWFAPIESWPKTNQDASFRSMGESRRIHREPIRNIFARRFPDLGKHQSPKTKLQTA